MARAGFRVLWFWVIVIAGYSCQKELKDEPYSFCLVDKVEVREGAGALPVEVYRYHYDPATHYITGISIDIPGRNFSREVNIVVNEKTFLLNGVGSLELDGSHRITHFKVKHALAGAPEGDYFFGYNSNGFLEDRLFDDGDHILERTIFSNNGKGLTGFEMTFENDPTMVSGEMAYQGAGNMEGDILLPYGDVFPELVPFFPLFKLGKLSPLPLASLKVKVKRTAVPELVMDYLYNGYKTNTAKALESFESQESTSGQAPVNKKFTISYICL